MSGFEKGLHSGVAAVSLAVGVVAGVCALGVPACGLSEVTRPEAAVSNIVLSLDSDIHGLRLQVDYPDGFSHRLDILSCTNLSMPVWVLSADALETSGSNCVVWSDPVPGARCRFYLAGDHDLDADADGLPDACETLIYLTDPRVSDTDADGIPDGAEVGRGSDPSDAGSRTITIYANSQWGHDANDGLSAVLSGSHGPKRTISAINTSAYSGDTIRLAGGVVFDEPRLCLGNKSVVVCPVGSVVIHP